MSHGFHYGGGAFILNTNVQYVHLLNIGILVILVVLHDNFIYLMLSLLIRANNVAVHQEKAKITLDICSV